MITVLYIIIIIMKRIVIVIVMERARKNGDVVKEKIVRKVRKEE